jgi:hypothetical protein
VLHALGCCWGLFVGFAAVNLFWNPQPNERGDALVRPLGLVMLVAYGWFLGAFLLRLKRGTWSSHCDRQVLFFSGIEPSTGKQVASAKRAVDLHVTANQILAASLTNLALAALLFVGVRLRWHNLFMGILFSLVLLSHPLLGYIAVRKMTETGFSWRCFFSAILCCLGIFLWAQAFSLLMRQWEQP